MSGNSYLEFSKKSEKERKIELCALSYAATFAGLPTKRNSNVPQRLHQSVSLPHNSDQAKITAWQ